MSKYDEMYVTLHVAGWGGDWKGFAGVSSCGDIVDGVSFYPIGGAGGTMAFADLERWYLAAKAYRKTPDAALDIAQNEKSLADAVAFRERNGL